MEVARRQVARFSVIALIVLSCVLMSRAQSSPHLQQEGNDEAAQDEFQIGTQLTRRGHFAEAIPHLLVAQGRVRDAYAASFNLALSYVGTAQYKQAIKVLNEIRSHGKTTAEVESLLAQASIGEGDQQQALAAAESAAHLAPKNEKLYLLTTDACMENGDFDLGLKIAELGLREL